MPTPVVQVGVEGDGAGDCDLLAPEFDWDSPAEIQTDLLPTLAQTKVLLPATLTCPGFVQVAPALGVLEVAALIGTWAWITDKTSKQTTTFKLREILTILKWNTIYVKKEVLKLIWPFN